MIQSTMQRQTARITQLYRELVDCLQCENEEKARRQPDSAERLRECIKAASAQLYSAKVQRSKYDDVIIASRVDGAYAILEAALRAYP